MTFGYDAAWVKREAIRREAKERGMAVPSPAYLVSIVSDHESGKTHDIICESPSTQQSNLHWCWCAERGEAIRKITEKMERVGFA